MVATTTPKGNEGAWGCVDCGLISDGGIALKFGGALWVKATIASSASLMLWGTSPQAQYAAATHMGSTFTHMRFTQGR